jgi:HEAT repeat protein
MRFAILFAVLVGCGGRSELPRLIAQLRSPDPDDRWRAAEVVGNLGANAEEAVPHLIRALADPNDKVRFHVRVALSQIGSVARIELIKALNGKDLQLRLGAILTLGFSDPRIKRGFSGEDDRAVFPFFLKCLSDKETEVRSSAASCFFVIIRGLPIGEERKNGIKALVESLDDTNEEVQVGALRSLKVIAGNTKNKSSLRDSAGIVAKLLGKGRPAVRAAAATALGEYSPDDQEIISDLVSSYLHDSEPDVESAAYFAIGRLGSGRTLAIGLLCKSLDDKSRGLRLKAIQALNLVAPLPAKYLPRIIKSLSDEDDEIKELSAEVVGRAGPEATNAVSSLEKGIANCKLKVRVSFASALWEITHKPQPAIKVLIEGLEHPNSEVRGYSAMRLGEIGPPAKSAITYLKRLAEKESDSEVRRLAETAITRIDGE